MRIPIKPRTQVVFSPSHAPDMESEHPMPSGFPSGRFRFLPSISCRNTLCEPRELDPTVWKVQLEGNGPPESFWNGRNCLEQREQFRYGVSALVDFEWMDEGVLRRGQGLTRDISSKGMFIYSDSEPPTKTDLRVKVSFGSVAEGSTNVQLKANALVVRVEPSSITGIEHGFAILNRSCQVHDGVSCTEN